MLTARLKAPPERQHRIVESALFTCEEGVFYNSVAVEVAKYADGLWRCESVAFISIDFDAAVLVKFYNPKFRASLELGPFPLRIIGGSMCNMSEVPEIIAEFVEPEKALFVARRPAVAMPRFTIAATA